MRMIWPQGSILKRISTRFIYSTIIAYSLFIFLYSCGNDPNDLGNEILPSSDNIIVKVDSTTLITSYTISGKRVVTSVTASNQQLYALGSLNDSIFGLSTASVITQFHPEVLITADSLRTVDSLILVLSSVGHYGDTLSNMTVRIFELNEELSRDSVYYSDINPADYSNLSTELANSTFTAGDTLIRVKITDPGFINKFASAPDSIFKDLSDFQMTFYGLFISVDQVDEKGGFASLSMSSPDTRFTLYYNGDTISKIYEMRFSIIAAKANVFSHNYTGFPIAESLDKPENQDSSIYIEGLAGTSGRISFPDLEIWKSKGLITINKAELILPVDSLIYPSLSRDEYPSNLFLVSLQDNNYRNLYDDLIDETNSYFGGVYSKLNNAYVFNIGLHLQSFISGKIENSDLVLISGNTNSAPDHVILKGASAKNSPVKLKVIYTELF